MTKVVHIVHVIYRFDTGGLENGLVNLINNLDPNSFRHSIVTLCGRSELFCQRIKSSNVDYFDLAKKPGQDLGMFFRLYRILKQIKPDILHTRNTATIECQFVGWLRRVPLRIHGEHGWDVNDLAGSNLRYQKLRRALRPFIHKYIGLSSEAITYLTDKIKVKKSNIYHICNGVDCSKFAVQEFVPKQKVVIGCVGRLEEVKNHQLLVEAFAIAASKTEQVMELHLVGNGSLSDSLDKQCKERGIESKVWMAGNRDDVHVLMQNFDVFVLPSLAEGISNTILEAMAVGLPVIATNVGGSPDLIIDGETGYLVNEQTPDEMAEKILSYVLEPSLRKSHGEAGRKRIEEEFSLGVMTQKYQAVYQELST